MLAHDEWLSIIKELVREIATPEEQNEKWFGNGPLYSSPVELYNQLFDDYTFDLFYERYSGSFTIEQRLAWLGLKEALDKPSL